MAHIHDASDRLAVYLTGGSTQQGLYELMWCEPYRNAPCPGVASIGLLVEAIREAPSCRGNGSAPMRAAVRARSALSSAGPQRAVQVERSADQCKVRESLREVSQGLATMTGLFRIEAKMVGKAEHPLRHEHQPPLRIADIIVEEAVPHPRLGGERQVRRDQPRCLRKARFEIFDDARRLEHELAVVHSHREALDRPERGELAGDRLRAIGHLRLRRNCIFVDSPLRPLSL